MLVYKMIFSFSTIDILLYLCRQCTNLQWLNCLSQYVHGNRFLQTITWNNWRRIFTHVCLSFPVYTFLEHAADI